MKFISFLCTLILMLFCVLGCKSSKDDITSQLKKMTAKHVFIPYEQMFCWSNDSLQSKHPSKHVEYKLIVYIDSLQCSTCYLQKMHLWNDFIELEQKYNGRFKLIIIVQSSKGSPVSSLLSAFQYYKIAPTVYIDSLNIFTKKNPHIPSKNMYHVFLLDEKDSVVLVGNPQFNSKIENKLLQILEKNK